MSWTARPVSPLGSSRFEQPWTPSTPTSPESSASRYNHASKPSLSRWSASDSNGYSTAASSIHQAYEATEPAHYVRTARDDSRRLPAQYNKHLQEQRAGFDEPMGMPYVDTRGPLESEEWYAHLNEAEDEYYIGDECPDGATLAATYHVPIFSADGQAIPFGTIHHTSTAIHQRQLIVFIRHFFCGACQAYVKALTEAISLQEYYAIPIPTSIIIIGCGQPNLIPFYKEVTGTSFPVFAEPSRRLYKKLGMVLSVKIGSHRPDYMRDISAPAWLAGQVVTISQGLRARQDGRTTSNMSTGSDLVDSPAQHHRPLRRVASLRKRDIVRGGNLFQIGGEMLFEDGEVIWCHRMRHYRDHVEVSDIRRLLDLDD